MKPPRRWPIRIEALVGAALIVFGISELSQAAGLVALGVLLLLDAIT